MPGLMILPVRSRSGWRLMEERRGRRRIEAQPSALPSLELAVRGAVDKRRHRRKWTYVLPAVAAVVAAGSADPSAAAAAGWACPSSEAGRPDPEGVGPAGTEDGQDRPLAAADMVAGPEGCHTAAVVVVAGAGPRLVRPRPLASWPAELAWWEPSQHKQSTRTSAQSRGRPHGRRDARQARDEVRQG